jgi:ketosteroid isomerase-like protein
VAVEEVLRAEREWVSALLRLDVPVLERLMASDYVQIDGSGSGRLVDKSEVLASFRSGERNWAEAHSDDHRVHVYGDVAVVVGRWRARGTNAGRTFDYAARCVAVWARHEGEWRMVSDQSTQMAQTG